MPYPFSPGEILTATNLNSAIGCVLLAEQSVTSGTAVTFSAISQDYSHLRIVARLGHSNASAGNAHRGLGLRFNGDTAGNYNHVLHAHDGAGTLTTLQQDAQTAGVCGYIGDSRGIAVFDIAGYTVNSATHVAMGMGSSRINNGTATTGWREFKGSTLWLPAATTITSVSLVITAGGGDEFSTSLISLYGFV